MPSEICWPRASLSRPHRRSTRLCCWYQRLVIMDKKALVCSVCDNTWNSTRHQPVALPACGHTFCRNCLIKIHNVWEENMKCPTCRKRHEGPKPEDLPANFALLHLLDDNVEDASHMKEDSKDMSQNKYHSEDSEIPKKNNDEPEPKDEASEDEKKSGTSTGTKALIGAAVGGVGCVIAAPFVLPAIGFTSAGIAGGSWAASMMSSAAIANGGGVAAGSLVATLQSFGAAGITAAGNAVIGAVGAAAGAGVAAATNAAAGGNNPEGDGEKDKSKENETDK